jgi:hypothetical protein
MMQKNYKNKEKISSLDKVKKIARGLKNKWAVPIGVTTTLLSKMGFGKALAVAGGPPGMVASIALDSPMLVDAAKTVKEDIIDPVVVEPAAKKMVEGENILKRMFTPNMNQGGMMNINEMIRPIGMAAGGPIPPEEPKKENKNGFGSLLMDFIRSEGMFAPSGKKFDTSDSPMFKDVKPIGLLDDAADLRILSMKLVLKEAADSLLEMDEIDNMTPIEIEEMYNSLMGKKGA